MTGGNTLNRPKTVRVHLQTVLVWYDAFDWQLTRITMKCILSCVAVSWQPTCFCSLSNGRHLPVERKVEIDWHVFSVH